MSNLDNSVILDINPTQPHTQSSVKWTCPICASQDSYPMAIVPCGHGVCDICSEKIGQSTSCPMCRTLIEGYVSNFSLANILGISRHKKDNDKILSLSELKEFTVSLLQRSSTQLNRILEIYGSFILDKLNQTESRDFSLLTIRFDYTYDEFREYLEKRIPNTTDINMWKAEYWKHNLHVLFTKYLSQFEDIEGTHYSFSNQYHQVEIVRLHEIRRKQEILRFVTV